MSPGPLRTRKGEMLFPSLRFLGDLVALLAASLGSYALRFASGWFPTPLGVPAFRIYLLATGVVCLVTLVVFHQRGHYASRRRGDLRRDLGDLASGLTVSFALQLSFLFFWRGFSFSRSYVLTLVLAAFLSLLLARRLLRLFQGRAFARGRGVLNMALLGHSPMSGQVWQLFRDQPGYGLRPLGLIEDEQSASESESIPLDSATPVLGGSDRLEELVREHELDTILVTLPFTRYHRFLELASRLSSLNVNTYLVPDLVGLLTTRLHHFEIEGLPFLAFRHVPLSGFGRVLKRSFDIVASGLGLLLLTPVYALIALAVLIDDGRPVFYGQVRLGRDGRRFTISKFRSMRRDAEAAGAGWSTAGDPRRTRLGGFLRASSLDELPQLWNVLRGEMSLVGPRPERPEYVEAFAKTIPRYFERHRVRSGITGWAQVNGLRGDTPIEERSRYDLFYVENWSLGFDLKILWLTLRAVFKGDNAY
jgi:exopolysaccharide biosynthesis polyprenyl glycosylphosphotransferase